MERKDNSEISGQKTAIIIGAGPAGLTAAYELLKKTDIKPVIFEMSDGVGGISKTINFRGNKMDLGGHRFFSKSKDIMDFWNNILPKEKIPEIDPKKKDEVMLVCSRLSRIFFLNKFFNYPISLNWQTIKNLGIWRLVKIIFSYTIIRLFSIKPEKTLEDFFINRFGKELYLTFFKDYTEKVWGIPCNQISADWGAQRVKGLSISKAIKSALSDIFSKKNKKTLLQDKREISLIEQFLYPKFGSSQMWDKMASIIKEKGGKILTNKKVVKFGHKESKINYILVKDSNNGTVEKVESDYFFSTMPVKELIENLHPNPPKEVIDVAKNLQYRDFIIVGLLLDQKKPEKNINGIKDNWIYIQEKSVKAGRLDIFNNWSPYLVDDDKIFFGVEYFCSKGDDIWIKSDEELKELAMQEIEKIGFLKKDKVFGAIVNRVEKAYPAYFGSYDKFEVIKNFTDKIENLFLIGRNGMHRYNNMDHSMLTAMTAVDNIIQGRKDKSNIWSVNAEKEYHEEK